MQRNIVKVNIFGTEYPIKGDTDADCVCVHEVASRHRQRVLSGPQNVAKNIEGAGTYRKGSD